jgi:hypothetical protein
VEQNLKERAAGVPAEALEEIVLRMKHGTPEIFHSGDRLENRMQNILLMRKLDGLTTEKAS